MKRVIALLLVICMLGIALIACGKKEDPKPTQKPSETETATDEMGQPDIGNFDENYNKLWYDGLDFEGDSLNIMVLNDEKVRYEWETEDPGDDELDQQIAIRNEVVESELNLDVNIVLTQGNSGDGAWQYKVWETEFTTAITQDVDNKLHELDAVANFGFDGLNNNLREYYANILDKDTFPYFNLKLPCWNQQIVKNGTMNGRLYGISGDMNLSLFNTALIIWQNDVLYEQSRKDEDPENIQKLVLEGMWTYAELYRWAKWSEPDAENNGVCPGHYGVSIQGDQYPENPTDCIPYAWDLNLIITNADGTHTYNFIGNERAEAALQDMCKLYNAEGNFWKHYSSAQDKTKTCSCGGGHFVGGGVIFKGDVLYWDRNSNRQIREMEDQYSLLCWPKYNEEQKEYVSSSQRYFNCVSLLDHSESSVPTKGEAVSAYFQRGTEYSYTHVRGYYFEKIVKLKFFGTDDSTGRVTRSSTIFVNIVDSLSFDFSVIYSPALSGVMNKVFKESYKKCAGGGTAPTLQSTFEANGDTYNDDLAALETWFGMGE